VLVGYVDNQGLAVNPGEPGTRDPVFETLRAQLLFELFFDEIPRALMRNCHRQHFSLESRVGSPAVEARASLIVSGFRQDGGRSLSPATLRTGGSLTQLDRFKSGCKSIKIMYRIGGQAEAPVPHPRVS